MKNKKQQIILSGIQPTGELHLGNYLGALRNWVSLQDQYQCYFVLATYHSISGNYQPADKAKQILSLTIDYLAAGLDPKKCVIFNQTDVPETTELCWIFNTLTPLAELTRMTQFKDKAGKQDKNINMGLLDYPVLQAADILIYRANLVPVGKDQVQHVEITRSIAKWFNQKYGVEYFPIPEAKLTPTAKIMSLADPEHKMSKSSGPKHYIALNDSPETIKQKIAKAVTGSGQEKEIPAGGQNLLDLLAEFGTTEEIDYFKKQAQTKNIKYGELKQTLAEAIAQFFEPYRQKRRELENDLNYVRKVLEEGAAQARPVAQKTIKEVKEIIGVNIDKIKKI